MAIITCPGLLMFPHLWVPQPPIKPTDKPRYNCIIVFSEKAQKTESYAALKAAELEAARKFHGTKLDDKGFMRNFKWAFHDGEEMAKYQGFDPGTTFLKPWSYNRPGVVWGYNGEDGKPAVVQSPTDIWPGMLARIQGNFFGYNTSGNYGVNFGLDNVQITKRDMPRMDGRQNARDAFDAVEGEEPVDFGGDSDSPF